MKNRKVIVTAFLLIAVMVLGVGYAAVSDTLIFSGNATISDGQVQHEFDLDVRITEVSDDNATWYPYIAGTPEINRDQDLVVDIAGVTEDVQDLATFQIYNLTDAGEKQVIWFKVENASAHDAVLTKSIITENGTGDHFDSEYQVYESNGTTETTVLEAQSSVLVKLTITLKSTPSETYTGNFSFNILAEVQ